MFQSAAHFILTAVFDNPAASKKTQEGGVGGGHLSFWHDDMAHWEKKTNMYKPKLKRDTYGSCATNLK